LEHVLLVKMTPFQRKLYATFTEDLLAHKSVANPLKAFAVCCKIWNHPDVLCTFLRKKEASASGDLDLELEELSGGTNGTKKGGRKRQPKRSVVKAAIVEEAGPVQAEPVQQQQQQQQPHHQNPNFNGVPQSIMNGNSNGNQHAGGYDQQQQLQYHQQQQQYQQYQQEFQYQQQFQQQYPGQQYPPSQFQQHGGYQQPYGQQMLPPQQQQQQQQQQLQPQPQPQQQHMMHHHMQQQMHVPPQQQQHMPQQQQHMSQQQQQHMLQQQQQMPQQQHMSQQQQQQQQMPQQQHLAQQQQNGASPELQNMGQGFDPFSVKEDSAKRDEISYEWVRISKTKRTIPSYDYLMLIFFILKANGMFNDYETCQAENSNKIMIFLKLLEETIKIGERILLFTQSLLTLDLIEDFLQARVIPGT
jgi:hypothetical protein